MDYPRFPGSLSSRRTWKYDVFLSFSGADTRYSFTGHLSTALQRKGIFISKDDEGLLKGESIRGQLFQAIEQSRISIVIFSKSYAESTLCLDELAKISDRIGDPEYTVLPIFYDVVPSDVRHQRGDLKKAFDDHLKRVNLDQVQRWKLALTQVANLSGFVVQTKQESDIIDEIVKYLIHKLGDRFPTLSEMSYPVFPGSSSSRKTWKYDVFLSFRGADTRHSFTGHLSTALQRKGIFIFKDDEGLREGESNGGQLSEAIEQSQISIVIFSKSYAESTLCLDELAKISKRIGEPEYTVLPIFYDVDPSDVRHQRGDFKKSFDEHVKRVNIDQMQRWRLALTQVANLFGFVVQTKPESGDIDEIVKYVIHELGHRFPTLYKTSYPAFPGSSSSWRTWKYDVFLSFRGADTRNSFTSHLFDALQRKGIFIFKDDKGLLDGESNGGQLSEAIEQSQISIVIFSKSYAESTLCLDELAKISERIGEPEYTVLPIFYDVDPSVVRHQRGDFKKAFDEHVKHVNIDRVQRWRLALTQVANLSGFAVQTNSESDVIDKIVTVIMRKLSQRLSSSAYDLVGMQSRVKALENLLDLESDDVRMVGIWGMPGTGKTTLATVVFDRISPQFDASCFLLDVSKEVQKGPGLVRLQQQLLCNVLQQHIKIWEDHGLMHLISTRLRHLKALVVLDDVDHAEQLEKLVGKSEWFGPGSRIIVTTKHKDILSDPGVDVIYEVEPLNDDEAFQLLCKTGFKRDEPSSDFQEMTHDLLQYGGGLPLVIKELGLSFGRGESEWRDLIERLKQNSRQHITGVLETRFDRLEKKYKDLFVDVSCFFVGAELNYVMRILGHCGFDPVTGIGVLCDSSLISIVNGTLWMPNKLQELGWKIARGEFPEEPAKWSRLWLYKDLQAVKTGTENVEAIVLKQEDKPETPLKAEALAQMSRLRLVIFPDVKISGNLDCLSNELQFLSWYKYPFSYLPSFEPTGLVELIMPESQLSQLWKGIKNLPKLKSIDLHGSSHLIEMPNLKGVENLEELDLEGCTGLLEVDPSIGDLKKLRYLNLKNCDNLNGIPRTLFLLSSLETLDISGCSKLGRPS